MTTPNYSHGPAPESPVPSQPQRPLVPEPGWYPTAEGSHERYWNGRTWSPARSRRFAEEGTVLASAEERMMLPSSGAGLTVSGADEVARVLSQRAGVEVSTPAPTWGSAAAAAVPLDPYAELPDWARVPPLSRQQSRRPAGAHEQLGGSVAECSPEASGRQLRPMASTHLLALFGTWTIVILVGCDLAAAAGLLPLSVGPVDSRHLGLLVATPLAVALSVIEVVRVRRRGSRLPWLLAPVFPFVALARAVQSRSFLVWCELVFSCADAVVWFAPDAFLEQAARQLGQIF